MGRDEYYQTDRRSRRGTKYRAFRFASCLRRPLRSFGKEKHIKLLCETERGPWLNLVFFLNIIVVANWRFDNAISPAAMLQANTDRMPHTLRIAGGCGTYVHTCCNYCKGGCVSHCYYMWIADCCSVFDSIRGRGGRIGPWLCKIKREKGVDLLNSDCFFWSHVVHYRDTRIYIYFFCLLWFMTTVHTGCLWCKNLPLRVSYR